MTPRTVFLDMDGVLADGDLVPREYERLLGTVLAPALGGAPADWARVNRVVFPRVVAQCRDLDAGPVEADRRLRALCVQGMCRELGVSPPSDEDAAALAKTYDRLVRQRGDYFVPGAAESVRALAEHHTLHMASGNHSDLMEIMLGRLGVRDLIGVPCGSDLVGIRKERPGFYAALFALAGVAPRDAVVVDDQPKMLERAAELGAGTVLISTRADTDSRFDAVLDSVRRLPLALGAI